MYNNNGSAETVTDKKVNEVVKLWNTTQDILPPVKVVSPRMINIITRAYDKYGLENIKELFIKVNKTPKLNGTMNKDFHTTIDFVLTDEGYAKVLNGVYDEIEPKEPQEVVSIDIKMVAYKVAQEHGFKEPTIEKYRFTDQERELLTKNGRIDEEGNYISIPVEMTEEE